MRFLKSKRWRLFALATALMLFGAIGLWTYVVCTRDPISVIGFAKLKTDMNRTEVEKLLGGPASEVVRVDKDIFEFDTAITYVGPPPAAKMGEFAMAGLDFIGANESGRPVKEEHFWVGPEGRIIVSFDAESRVVAAWHQPRVTWRYKLRQWLPWLK